LRFWNNQVFEETESVLALLWQTLHERHSRSFEKEPLPCPPSPTGNEGVPENPNPIVSRYA
jgi:hypothetical protein